MSLLTALTTEEGVQGERDLIGGYQPLESGLYNCMITMAYLKKSSGGALGLTLHMKTEENREIRETIYVTSGDAKGNSHKFTNSKGEQGYLPGFLLGDSLCLLTVGAPLSSIQTEDKVVNVYSAESKKEEPTTVPVLMALLNQPITAGVLKQIEDKPVMNDAGKYVPSGETRTINVIEKFFRAADGLTVPEIRGGCTAAEFKQTWAHQNNGTVRDRSTKNVTAIAGATSSAFGQASAKPQESLFSAPGA